MTTEKQVRANRQNARKSTGPTSIAGKLKVSGNRITHGILSNKLLLAGEAQEDYQALLDDLQQQLRPVGPLELSLVEKIALTLWRQRRLVHAETATIELATNPRRIASEVESGMGFSGYGDETIRPEDLQPSDRKQAEQLKWCQALIAEYHQSDALGLDDLGKKAPMIHAQLVTDAKADNKTIPEYLSDTTLEDYAVDLVHWCHQEIAKLEKQQARYPALAALAITAREMLRVPWQKLDVLAKYQTTLDNQLYKAVKALRDAQAWRIKSIEAMPLDEESPAADAA